MSDSDEILVPRDRYLAMEQALSFAKAWASGYGDPGGVSEAEYRLRCSQFMDAMAGLSAGGRLVAPLYQRLLRAEAACGPTPVRLVDIDPHERVSVVDSEKPAARRLQGLRRR